MWFATEGAVVVGVDGSRSCFEAARWAAAEAGTRGLPLRLVHVYTVPLVRTELSREVLETAREGLESRGRSWLEEARTAVSAHWPELRVETAAREWKPVAALIHESLTAVMVVVGSRGLGGFAGLQVGSTAKALANHAHCPVVVVRGRPQDYPVPVEGPVVVGADGVGDGDAVVSLAFEEASLRGVPLTVVHTWDRAVGDDSGLVDLTGAEGSRVFELRFAVWRDEYPGVPVEFVLKADRPVRVLLEAAEHGQLMVLGGRGTGGFSGMLLGSTSQALVANSECPVAVVRPAYLG